MFNQCGLTTESPYQENISPAMMSDIQYKDYTNALIDKSLVTYLSYHNPMLLSDEIVSLVQQNDINTLEALSYWEERLTQKEIDKVKWYGDTFLTDIKKGLRDITSALIADLNHHQILRYWENSLRKYSINQPLFSSYQELLSHTLNGELIPSSLFQKVPLKNVVRFANGEYAYIDESLEPPLLQQLEERGVTYYVRVNPYYIYDTKPPIFIKEAAWRTPSPKWQNAIGIKPNQKDGFSYYIPEDVDRDTHPYEYMDRYFLHILRLEGEYKRKRDGYFSMMVEELKEVSHPFLEEFYIIGRMIHLDSIDDGEDGLNAKLKHIDLAVNIYTGDDAINRVNERLENGGKIVDATYRSHILRLNDAKLSDIIAFSTFFESKCLQEEWIKDMFTNDTQPI